MPRRIWSHFQGNVVAYLALFVALGGTAVASSIKLAPNSVGTAQLRSGAVTGAKVARNTLTGANIKLSTLGTVPSAERATNAHEREERGHRADRYHGADSHHRADSHQRPDSHQRL